jgi:hypothetical protein
MEAVVTVTQRRVNRGLAFLVSLSLIVNGFLLYYHFDYRAVWEEDAEAQRLAMVHYNTQVKLIDSIDTAVRLKLSCAADSLYAVIMGMKK